MTELVASLRAASTRALMARLRAGHAIDPRALEGWAYRGTNLAPALLRRLTWTRFQKTFWREPATGRLLGWNVRVEQRADGPSRPLQDGGRPRCVWHYEVIAPRGVTTLPGCEHGLLIDYARGRNPRWDLPQLGRDPLVALAPGNPDVLLGLTVIPIGPLLVPTPTFFVLEREHPITYVPYDT